MTRSIRLITTFLLTLFVAAYLAAQTQGVDILLSKARSLEARGRTDLAAQNWKQVLLVDPKQTEALAGLARVAKQNGDTEEERGYLDRLRKISPNHPDILRIEKMHVLTQAEHNRLDEAGRLTMQHRPDEAMKIYKEVFAGEPPYGKWAEPYYQAEAASTGGREKAISQLRNLSRRDPSNEVYRLWLARVLSYNPKTRMEGLEMLESIHDPGSVEQARAEWRQALLWEKDNPAVLASVNAYLQRNPDQELQGIQKRLQEMQEHAAEEASKERGFQALRGKDMSTAEAKFEEVLRRSPNDANAVAGMAFVRLNQKRFAESVSYFEHARTLAPKRTDVREGYETAKFWLLMQQGATNLEHNDSEAAITAYQQALALHPGDEEAMLGIAEAEVHEKRLPDAEAQFQQVLNHSPNHPEAIAGLAFIRLDEKKFDDAVSLFDRARQLTPNRAAIEQGYKDAKYWSLLQHAAKAMDQNQPTEAMADYQQALVLRPGASDGLRGLGGAAERSGNYPQAIQAYRQLTVTNPADAQSWLGLLRAEVGAKDSKQLIDTAQHIPPSVKPQIETRSDYLSELALAYYSMKQPEEGDRMLRRAMDAAIQADTTEALNARLEVANALMEQGRGDRAMEVYEHTTKLHPDNMLAWQALVGAYARERNFRDAKTVVRSMPQAVYEAASRNAGFLNSLAAIYSADGDCREAEDFLNRSLNLDRAAGRQPAENTQLQLADIWLREDNNGKAREAYHEILAKDQNSVDAWRGYLTALHNERDDRSALAEVQRMPAAVRAHLEADASFLIFLAGSYSASGHYADTVHWLQQARGLYLSKNQTPPAELDVQLGWAMLNDRQSDPRLFLQKLRARKDLTERQRAAVNDIWSDWSLRAAQQAVQNKKPDQALIILADAQRDLPNDPRIYGAIASVYVHQHNYQKALAVYQSWGMNRAEAADYRAAAGTALAAHRNELVNFYLAQGLQRFPTDADLLEMKGKQDIAHGNYKEGQTYLKSALRASRNPASQRQSFIDPSTSERAIPPDAGTRPGRLGPATVQAGMPTTTMPAPACRQTTSYLMPKDLHLRLVSANYEEQAPVNQNGAQPNAPAAQDSSQPASTEQSGENQNSGTQTDPAPPTANPPSPNQNSADQNSTHAAANAPNPDNPASSEATPEKQQQIQDEIDVVENRNTPYAMIDDAASGRAGDPGIDRLIIEDGMVGGSVVGGNRVRLSTQAEGLYLFSGTPNGQSKHPFGTLPAGMIFRNQSVGGLTGDLQLSTGTFGLDFSATPHEFPVQNVIGGIRFRPLGGPVTFIAYRDSVKDSLLSYAGVRDPGTGIAWGGVVSNTGTLQLDHKSTHAGQYASVSFAYVTGTHVPSNWVGSGNAGLYFMVVKGLSVGLSLTGMHYNKNLSYFTLGQGGYFSPQQYGIASIPISWFSRHKRFEYEIRASLGAQYIQQDTSPFFPTRFNLPLPPQGVYTSATDVGPNYNFWLRLGYRLAPHLYFDTFATANNARNYATQTIGFSLKILARPLPTHTDLHVNSVPDWKGNQPFGIEP